MCSSEICCWVAGSVLCDSVAPVVCASRIQARIVLFNLEIPITRGFTVSTTLAGQVACRDVIIPIHQNLQESL